MNAIGMVKKYRNYRCSVFAGRKTANGDDLERQTEREVWPIFHAFHLYFHSPTTVFAQLFHSCFYFFSTKECLHKSGGGNVEEKRSGRDTFPISVFRIEIKKHFQRYTKIRAYPGNRRLYFFFALSKEAGWLILLITGPETDIRNILEARETHQKTLFEERYPPYHMWSATSRKRVHKHWTAKPNRY